MREKIASFFFPSNLEGDERKKWRAIRSMVLSGLAGLAFAMATIRGDWWIMIFSGFAQVFNFAYMICHYRKEMKENA